MGEHVVIIGGGQAGLQAAASLRQNKYAGDVTILCAEECLPYQRPPLSKAYLKGELAGERLYFRPDDFFETQNINLRLSTRATSIDPKKRIVETAAGDNLAYDRLLIATGAPPRKLNAPGGDLGGLYYLRTLKDSDALRPILSRDGRIVIVGAGYIGLEVAAVMRAAGKDVTVLEMADRVLARVASPPVSAFYAKLHADAGVEFRFKESLDSFVGKGDVEAVKTSSGDVIECSAALIGIGANPDIQIAKDAGLDVENGIVVDEFARTSDPNIWAAGDCANFPSKRYGRRLRLESVPNAIEQAKAAATNMAGGDVVYDPLPWFWSDQYDVKLQTVGLIDGADETIVRRSPDTRKFSVWYFKDGALLAVDAINEPAAFAMGKKALTQGLSAAPADLADETNDLRTLFTA